MNTTSASFLFHDYETWGVNPKFDFPCQFAAIRTDADLNIIDQAYSYYCQIPNDYLPHPGACLVTGITPQKSLRDGLIEAEFSSKIHQLMNQDDTCVVGYNSIRFDDEVTRNLFYRNFYDPYEREYKNGNSRWDIIDLARACYALRPNGIEWVFKEDGRPSFKLEELSKANNISHEAAHDAVSDVKATIAFAKCLKDAQPRLFSYYFDLRQKQNVQALINYNLNTPLVYVSGTVSAQQACTTLVLPICPHPSNKNAIICIDLSTNADIILDSSTQTLEESLYAKDIKPNQRPGIKVIHANKSPFLASAKLMNEEVANRITLDLNACRTNLLKIRKSEDVKEKLSAMFNEPFSESEQDIDASLYSRGFLNSADKIWMEKVRGASPEDLAQLSFSSPSNGFSQQLIRYRARNFPDSLDAGELEKWQRHRHMRLSDGTKKTCLSAQEYQEQIVLLVQQHAQNPNSLAILRALEQYLTQMY